MNKQQRIKHGFVSLLYSMSASEQYLLLMISNQTKARNVLRFEGKIEVDVGEYQESINGLAEQPLLSDVVRGLLSKTVDLTDNQDWNLVPIFQEVGSCNNRNKIFIAFNQSLIPYLSEIEVTLNYDLKDAERVSGAEPNRFYSFISQYLDKGEVTFSLKELQKEFCGLHGLAYFTKYSAEAAVATINYARASIKVDLKTEDNPTEDNNPLFTFSVVKRYE